MRVLVSGAGGFVGRHLVAQLQESGHEVVALRRDGAAAAGDFAGPADLAAIDRFPDWPRGIEAVAHLAALNPSRGEPTSRDLAALRHANLTATAALARRARREGVRRMVLVGSAAVHAPGASAVTEADPPVSQTPYAVSKREAEAAFRRELAGGETEGVVLRPAPVFGPGAGNLTSALARLARTPLPLPLAGLGAARSLVSVDALADAIALSLYAPAAGGQTFLVASDGPLTPAGIVAALRAGAGRAPLLLPAPVRLAKLAAQLAGRRDAFASVEQGLVLDSRHLRATLRWRPDDARTALAAMAASGRL